MNERKVQLSPFKYNDYKDLIRDAISSNTELRGYQGKIAEAGRCQKSYFSKVLNGDAHLNTDQAMGISEFLQLNEDETEYFLELVSLARSSYPPLLKRIKGKLRLLREKQEKGAKAAGASEIVSNNEWQYYSQWHWSAIHIIVGISRFQTVAAISKSLNLNESIVLETLVGLQHQGLVEIKNGRWNIKPVHRHLDSNSPLNTMNHTNWRNKAIQDSQRFDSESLHYTSVQTHSLEDTNQLKEILLRTILKTRNLVKVSEPDEQMTAICIDFFRLT